MMMMDHVLKFATTEAMSVDRLAHRSHVSRQTRKIIEVISLKCFMYDVQSNDKHVDHPRTHPDWWSARQRHQRRKEEVMLLRIWSNRGYPWWVDSGLSVDRLAHLDNASVLSLVCAWPKQETTLRMKTRFSGPNLFVLVPELLLLTVKMFLWAYGMRNTY
jgi:hypothetical protein